MFKYLRSINGTVHSEIESFFSIAEPEDFARVDAGTLFTLASGLVNGYIPNFPIYLALSSINSEEEGYVKALRLTSDMIFECDVDTAASSEICVGTLCGIETDNSEKGISLTINDAPAFEVLDISNITKGKVIAKVI